MLLPRTRTLHRQLAARFLIPLARMSHHPPFKQVSELSSPSSSPDRPRTLDCSPTAGCGQVEGSRPEFDTTQEWTTTKVRPSRCPLERSPTRPTLEQTPAPEWKVGSGSNGLESLAGVKEGLWDGTQPEGRFCEVDPAKEAAPKLYKMLISARLLPLTGPYG